MQAYTWIYSFESPLTDFQKKQLNHDFQLFLSKWSSHGIPVNGMIRIAYDRFVLINADQGEHRPSGCSIDSLKRAVAEILEKNDISVLDAAHVFYRDVNKDIQYTHFRSIQQLISSGILAADTIVFDHSLGQSDDLDKWEMLLKDTWMKRYLRTTLNS